MWKILTKITRFNEYEKYYQYRVSLRRNELEVGKNYITDKVVANVELENGDRKMLRGISSKFLS